MSSSPPPIAPLAILQADHVGKMTSVERQPACTQWGRMQSPTSCLIDSLRFFPHFALGTLSWLSRIFRVGLWTGVRLLPRLPAFLIKASFFSIDTCFSNYWLLSSEQPNLSSIARRTASLKVDGYEKSCRQLRPPFLPSFPHFFLSSFLHCFCIFNHYLYVAKAIALLG